MIHFTDKRLYLKGTSEAICTDKATGDIVYYSNKFQTGNVTTGVTMGEIRAGLGNAVAAIIPSDAAVNVEFTAADFSLWGKAAQVGATLKYSAPVMTCQNVTAESTALSADVTKGTPVAQQGMTRICCYVQEVGAGSLISTGGKAYSIDPATGAVSGFTAETGKIYKVWYFVNRADAQIATITSMLDPKVVHFTAAMAVYANESGSAQNEGTRVGTLYVIIPSLKFGANGGVVGDQTNNDTTSMSGQAVIYDSDVISENCEDCNGGGSDLAYYIYVPCESNADSYQGIIAKIGGVITMAKSSTMQVQPKAIMENGQLVDLSPSLCTYSASGVTGLTVSDSGLLTSGTTAGDGSLTVNYEVGGKTFTDSCTVTVQS